MANGELEPLFDADEIQGNILGGFNKDYQNLVFLAIPPPAISQTKKWLQRRLGSLTWLREVTRYRTAFKAHQRAQNAEPENMVVLWQNVAFSFQGLQKLASDAELFPVGSFTLGAAAASVFLGDPTSGIYSVSNWVVGSPTALSDIVWIIAGDSEASVEAETAQLQAEAITAGLQLVHIDRGRDLGVFDVTRKGHEHFGFKDGISQPGVRGKTSATEYLEPRTVAQSPDFTVPEYANQGRPLVCAGEFVIGYARQTPDFPRVASAPDTLGPKPSAPAVGIAGPWWAINGSFLVYRRLRQDVAGFNKFLVDQAGALPQLAHSDQVARLGALMVGRWKSGAPVIRSPSGDNPVLGADDRANNVFLYVAGGDPNDGFGPIPNDAGGTICPAAAHVRKVNPRDHTTDKGGENVTLTKRVLRRGIPYGSPLPNGVTADDGQDRGLLFLGYQRSIADQFEFLCHNWMNSSHNPQYGSNVGGFDLLVGQNGADATRTRQCFLPVGPSGDGMRIPSAEFAFQQYVNATGAGYFFSPSLTALRDVLSA